MPYMDDQNAQRLIDDYADMVLRISYLYLRQTCDAEDICQDVFLKLLRGEFRFESPEHEKAWIIRATINACKDCLRRSFWGRFVGLENAEEVAAPEPPDSEILDLVQSLPKNYRLAIYLYYYEGYKVKEIAEMLGKTENTVSAYLSRGRKRLRSMIESANRDTSV